MADEADLANDLMNIELRHALDKLRQMQSQRPKEGPKECVECGDDIQDARRALGYNLCINCAKQSERTKSLYADD